MKIDPNAPAFPASNAQCCGLTIRAEIAARVMAGLVVRVDITCPDETLALWSVSAADALIAALNKEAV